jgi:tetratricopeptide (TPR) repeat protein
VKWLDASRARWCRRFCPKAQEALARATVRDPAAREAYLKAATSCTGMPEGPEKALGFFRQATDIDRLYAEPTWARRRRGCRCRGLRRWRKARESRERGAGAGAEPGGGSLAMGNVRLYGDWDWPAARAEYERALSEAPGLAMAYYSYGSYFSSLGEHEEALAQARRALELDPVSAVGDGRDGVVLLLRTALRPGSRAGAAGARAGPGGSVGGSPASCTARCS